MVQLVVMLFADPKVFKHTVYITYTVYEHIMTNIRYKNSFWTLWIKLESTIQVLGFEAEAM